jgi:Kazal-type serine protease inhibitor-like protein
MTKTFAAAFAVLVASTLLSPTTSASDAPRTIGTKVTQSLPEARRPTICTEQYAPVCGRVGNVTKTYSNACFARAAGAVAITDGPCAG